MGKQIKNMQEYDHVIVLGKAQKPTYLTINDGEISFCSAQDIWGKDVLRIDRLYQDEEKGLFCSLHRSGRGSEISFFLHND